MKAFSVYLCKLGWGGFLVSLLCGGSIRAEAQSKPTPHRCIRLVPGQSLGPIRLGMNVAELKALKLGFSYTSPQYRTVAKVGSYRVVFDAKQNKRTVRLIQHNLKKVSCLKVGERTIDASRGAYGIASQLGRCLPEERRIGGNVIQCHNQSVWLSYKQFRGTSWKSLSVEKMKPLSLPTTHCANYLVPGSHVATPNKDWKTTAKRSVRTWIKPQRTYCVRGIALTTKTTMSTIPKIFWGECSENKVNGGWVVHCNHTRIQFFFGTNKRLLGWYMSRYNRKPQTSSFETFVKTHPTCKQIPQKRQSPEVAYQ
ncbi:MAG: hypothetical protein EP343_22150 [Deltaproteobacteria bacterium]|nr:MAG: hypothetical protein EP343_22150 [Deltaproteobacteria bacterium]